MKIKKTMRRIISGAEPLLSIHEVMHWKKVSQHSAGVYFLLRNEAIQYIGSSINVYARIGQHLSNGVPFDATTIEPCPAHLRIRREAEYIIMYNPPLNKTIPMADGRSLQLQRQVNASLSAGLDHAIDD